MKKGPLNYLSSEPLNFLLKPLGKSSNKGDFGHVAILEGHTNFIGASRLAARAALRVGAGLVTLLTSKTPSLHPSDLAEFMKKQENLATLEFFKKISCLVVGPGLFLDPAQLLFNYNTLFFEAF